MNFYQSMKNPARNLLATAGLVAALGVQAQAVWDIADMPLLAGDSTVAPNLIFMFDDSSSMTGTYGSTFADCIDAYNLFGRFRLSTDASKGFLWRNCTLYGKNQKTPFDLSSAYPYYADPSRLSGANRDLRTLATYSYTFNPLYYNPNMRYVPWPGKLNSNPLAAIPLATDPTAPATSTFNLINNAPLRRSMVNGEMRVNYVDTLNNTVPFPPEFPLTFQSNNVTPNFINSNLNNRPPPGYSPDSYSGQYGGGLHDAFEGTWNADNTIATIGPFFIAQYVQFTGNPLSDADVVDMSKYVTVKIDNPATAIPSGNTSYPPGAQKSAKRTDCIALTNQCTLAEEQTNFANWFTYYKTKRGMAIGTVAQAFANLPGNFRVGWGRLGSDNKTIDGTASTKYIVQGVRRWDQSVLLNGQTKKTSEHFMNWIATMGTGANTKLREELEVVGTYFKRTDYAGPWGNSPGNSADTTAQLGCRRNYHVAITDGAWSTGTLATKRGNVDGNNQGSNYIAAKPYSDAWSDTLADISMHYWANDLRPDMANNVSATPSDPATWQHLTNYYLMLNMTKSIDGDSAADMLALTNGTKTWPNPSDGDSQKIDDTLHAALNSRGKLFRVTGPLSVVDALSSIKRDMVTARSGSDAQVSISGEYLTGTSKKFKPFYTSNPWGGNLTATNLNADGSEGAPAWSAFDRLLGILPANRKIFTSSVSAGGVRTGVSFSKTSLPSGYAGVTLTSSELELLANYVRGDRSMEGKGYRTRASALGDIINSSPLLVGSALDSQYDLYSGTKLAPSNGKSSYRNYLTAKKARPERLFVGANDGMLHAFNASTGDEDFAYIPSSLLGNFFNFASPTYAHRYFVDGQITELDAYGPVTDDASSLWRNLVVASTGAGAKTVFAIKVPTGVGAAAPAAADVLWEVSNTSPDFSELGNTLSKLEGGLMRNGQYAVLINNGYASASGKASLFIVNALTGALIKTIDTTVGANTVAARNGLGGVRVIRNTAREIVAAYAGDLQGNMWKFDLSDPSVANWNLAFSSAAAKNPLFKANLPITAAPGLIANPLGGLMVIFGTGKMFENTDPSNTERGYVYSVWDKDPVGNSANNSVSNLANSNTLVEQTLTEASITQSDGSTKTFYKVSNNQVDYASKRGWFVRLGASERMVYDPQSAVGRIYIESIFAAGASASVTCNPSSFALNGYFLDAFTGSYSPDRPTLDTNGDGVIDSNDDIAAIGYRSPTVSRASVSQSKVGGGKGVLVSGTDKKPFNGNQSLVRRSWRQIVTPP